MEIKPTPVVKIHSELLIAKGVELFVKREDLNHPTISGNKARKLKYNLEKAREEEYDTLLTFGGAYSNHIYATAAAGAAYGFKTIGVIRGEETLPLSPTLQFAQDQGMTLYYIERTKYRLKNSLIVMNALQKKFGRFFTIPEGGSNQEAIVGCAEMINEVEDSYDYYFVSVGTGGTLAGIIEGLGGKGKIIGFSSLKGEFLTVEVSSLLSANGFKTYDNWEINGKYHFGGYAKFPNELKDFMCTFEETHGFQLDPIYTAKAMYGALDMIKQDMISSGSKVLFLHTGGLQGRKGFGLD